MKRTTTTTATSLVLANCVSLALVGLAHAQTAPATTEEASGDARLDQLEHLVKAQTEQLEALRDTLAEQERNVAELRSALAEERLDNVRGLGGVSGQAGALPLLTLDAAAAATGAQQLPANPPREPVQESKTQQPVGRAPAEAERPPEVAQIFDQPGVLTPRGKFVVEPAVQFGYSANDRVALVGFTVIPAILIGLIDVRQVKTTSANVSLTGRYGLTNRLEIEAKVPYVYVNGDTVSREIFTGSAQDKVFNASGHGIGDVEVTARYQLNRGAMDRPFYVGWLRYKSRTGKDLFEVVTDCVTRCVANATGTGLPLELPIGSGFESIQPGLTWLYASDPVVFFGSFSYLYNFPRKNVSRTVLSGAPPPFSPTSTEFIGEVKAGDIIGFNVGLGLALNEKAAISIGYDQNLVGKTEQNGMDVPGSVRVILGTLLLGGSYRFNERVSLNVALGVGVTRDTPDVSLTVRVPITF
ncbi:acetate kinase [Lysobacter koreensis]|uniref:Acetate kinase n=1 Tax=Lysobacter koreensis TaxID=266122 RepID=A0ABW2YID4_9GAMM